MLPWQGPVLGHKAQETYPRILDAIFDVVEGTRPKIEISGSNFKTRYLPPPVTPPNPQKLDARGANPRPRLLTPMTPRPSAALTSPLRVPLRGRLLPDVLPQPFDRDGTAVRDYVHVSDLVGAHLAAFKSLESSTFEAFNIGTVHGPAL